jgi:hypothetical protein
MKYKTIYMTHDVSTLVTKAKEKSGEAATICEMGEWDSVLDKHAQEGWAVKKCGTISTNNKVIFWALLKKKDEKEFDI